MSYLNGEAAHWLAQSPAEPTPLVPLPTEKQDLVIVGGGMTGLWSAYYARRAHPEWSITVIEAKHVGYGASGRNGGWLSTLMPGNRARFAEAVDRARSADPTGPVGSAGLDGVESVRSFQSALFDSIDEVLDVLDREGIDAHQVRGGHLDVAQTQAGMARLEELVEANEKYGYGPEDMEVLDAEQTRARVNVDQAMGGVFVPGTARIDPALLVRGLARVLRDRGVTICEDTAAAHISPGAVATNRGPVSGETILVCLEGYSDTVTGDLPGLEGRQVIPVFSSMIATNPLPADAWASIGWEGRECLGDTAHTFIYAQRTADDRIAIGGRGAPYAFRSGLPGAGEVPAEVVDLLRGRLSSLFPDLDFEVAHAWRGALGVTRDWCAGIFFDQSQRIGVARGYAGHGVTATHLAAKTLLDRAAGASTPLTALPWNDHFSGQWEPEPIRWLGVRSMYKIFTVADAWEKTAGAKRTSLLARFGSHLAGLAE
ncbi:glycine/D-amino acid oxidase-like deaminating enzyme [Brevibacterium sanguinis]|uniref:Glycine/D-amino acid oxidase-like deaminating enzyme n=2 Tax=Brevibacterium TaxID=1696 RepID=A0A366II82_9MICO|nr:MULTISPECIES: FAD-dependent oxidoreductase [Brevibacterium]RBP62013.1 glycine/D-amino acid oxidase-like deaminating enzyme [Brevibacterium sanguinis]RBP70565.1 glycine/D-amino acid oxidase-like deaminating enzyme [Brevibacterium celere]